MLMSELAASLNHQVSGDFGIAVRTRALRVTASLEELREETISSAMLRLYAAR